MRRRVELLRESNDSVIARVPLDDSGEVHCEMDLSSYHGLLGLGYVSKLGYTKVGNRKYVSYRDPKTTKHILVARMLAGCKEGEIAKYKDGNPLNLRINNLKVL